MVKICPNCGEKNFDDALFCMSCTENIKNVKTKPEVQQAISFNVRDEFEGLRPRGYKPQPWQGRYYSKLGLLFAGLYLLFFFIYSLFIILFIFSILVVVLGWVGIKNGDELLGKFSFGVGILLFLITITLFIISFF